MSLFFAGGALAVGLETALAATARGASRFPRGGEAFLPPNRPSVTATGLIGGDRAGEAPGAPAPANASRAAAATERLPGDAGGVATTGVCGGAPRGVRLGEPTSSRLPLVDGDSTDSTSADAGRDP